MSGTWKDLESFSSKELLSLFYTQGNEGYTKELDLLEYRIETRPVSQIWGLCATVLWTLYSLRIAQKSQASLN